MCMLNLKDLNLEKQVYVTTIALDMRNIVLQIRGRVEKS